MQLIYYLFLGRHIAKIHFFELSKSHLDAFFEEVARLLGLRRQYLGEVFSHPEVLYDFNLFALEGLVDMPTEMREHFLANLPSILGITSQDTLEFLPSDCKTL